MLATARSHTNSKHHLVRCTASVHRTLPLSHLFCAPVQALVYGDEQVMIARSHTCSYSSHTAITPQSHNSKYFATDGYTLLDTIVFCAVDAWLYRLY